MTLQYHKGNGQTFWQWARAGIAHFWRTVQARNQVRRERQLLSTLNDRMLKDIGLTRAEAHCEAARPGWDVPQDRLPPTPEQTGTRTRLPDGIRCS